MMLSPQYGHHFREMVLSLLRNTTFHPWKPGFCQLGKWGLGGVHFRALVDVWAPFSFIRALLEAKRHFSSLKSWILPTLQMGARVGSLFVPS